MTRPFPDGVRAVLFDAVGTLIHPDPPAGLVYAEVGRRFGSRLGTDEVCRRFGEAFGRQEEIDRRAGLRTDEGREQQRWRAIVAEVLADVSDPEGCFEHLWGHFGRPGAWRSDPEAGPALLVLRRRGYRVGVASN